MIPLTSSNLSGYDYDEATQVLKIRFTSGRTYTYNNVPADVVSGLASAASPGQYFNAAIKGQFDYS